MAGATKSEGASAVRKRARIGTILVPTDFSDESLKAIRYATSLLRVFDGALHLVHVHDVDYSYAVPAMMAVTPMITAGEVEAYCRGELQKVATEHVRGDATSQLHCATGRAFDEICKLAAELPADLIVISTHGRTGLRHLVLGSTTERVVRHASCPVLVVREIERDFAGERDAGARAETQLQLRNICVPIDFSECSARGVRYAVWLAKACGAKLRLVHSLRVEPFIPSEPFVAYNREPAPGVIERAARIAMRKFVQAIDFDGVAYDCVIEVGRPGDRIIAQADAHRCELIIIPTQGVTGFAHVMLGSTAEHVVRQAHCPVLVVPHRERDASPRR